MSHDLPESKRRLHKLRHDLESSKVQHVTLKTFRDEKANSNQVNYYREVLSERKPHAFKKVQ